MGFGKSRERYFTEEMGLILSVPCASLREYAGSVECGNEPGLVESLVRVYEETFRKEGSWWGG